jgi:hypothetical protein
LFRAGHHHSYELALTVSELQHLEAEVRRTTRLLGSRYRPSTTSPQRDRSLSRRITGGVETDI